MTKKPLDDPPSDDSAPGGAADGAGAGRDRRRPKPEREQRGRVTFDDRGNAVWEWTETPRRRADDDTLDLLKQLDPEDLSLADNDAAPGDASEDRHGGFDPYDKSDKKR